MIGGQSISGVVITLNEERNIVACLESIKWADEIVVVDSYSRDATVELARRYTDRIIQRRFTGFVSQMQFAVDQAGCDWVLWLDADERLTAEAVEEMRREFERPGGPECDGFEFRRKTWLMGRWIMHGGWYPEYRLRLFRRGRGRVVGQEPHSSAVVSGPVKRLRGEILHLSYPGGLGDLARRAVRYAEIAARERHAAGKRFSMLNLLARPPLAFLKRYVLRLGALDGMPGLAIAVGAAYYRFLREMRLWELERGAGEGPG